MTKFQKKLDYLFWFLVATWPLIAYVVLNWNAPNSVEMSAIIEPFRFDYIADLFNQIFTQEITFPAFLVDFLSYFVSVEIIHVFIDFCVFIPRFAHNVTSRLYHND